MFVIENKLLYLTTGPVPHVPLGVADVKRAGTNVTVVALGSMVPDLERLVEAVLRIGDCGLRG